MLQNQCPSNSVWDIPAHTIVVVSEPFNMNFSKSFPWLKKSPPYNDHESESRASKEQERLRNSDDEENDEEDALAYSERYTHHLLRRKPSKRAFCFYLSIALCAFIALLVIGIFALQGNKSDENSHDPAKKPSPSFSGSRCGNSSKEALIQGCSFDQLTWAWYPPECPHYANPEFVKEESWTFYLDKEGTTPAVGEDWRKAMDNEIGLWGERREHLSHCVYMMLSAGQIVRGGTPYAAKLVDEEHLDHCAHLLLETLRKYDPEWHSMETKVPPVDYSVSC